MLTLRIVDIHKLFTKESYTGKKIIDPEADDLIIEEAEKYKVHKMIKIMILVQQKFTSEEEFHFKNKFKEYYLRRIDELHKEMKKKDKKFKLALRKGLFILALYISLSFLARNLSSNFAIILSEIAIIAGWVSIWKPFEYYIYERPNQNNLIKICENLTKVDVEVLHKEAI